MQRFLAFIPRRYRLARWQVLLGATATVAWWGFLKYWRSQARFRPPIARHRHREAGGRRHHGGTRRRPAWQVFMNERER
jgi:hypothetical protein